MPSSKNKFINIWLLTKSLYMGLEDVQGFEYAAIIPHIHILLIIIGHMVGAGAHMHVLQLAVMDRQQLWHDIMNYINIAEIIVILDDMIIYPLIYYINVCCLMHEWCTGTSII